MKKIVLSLVSLIVLGTGTGFCSTNSFNHGNGDQPREEMNVNFGQKKDLKQDKKDVNKCPKKETKKVNKCNCKNCQKKNKKQNTCPKHHSKKCNCQMKNHR